MPKPTKTTKKAAAKKRKPTRVAIQRAPMGRPTKFKPEYVEQAKLLARKGFIDTDLAELWQVTISTIHLWKLKHPEFSDALKMSKGEADDRVERALFERATGYAQVEDDIRTVDGRIVVTPTVKRYPPDTTAGIFWLKNRRRQDWQAKPEGPDDETPPPGSVTVTVVSGRKQSSGRADP